MLGKMKVWLGRQRGAFALLARQLRNRRVELKLTVDSEVGSQLLGLFGGIG
jgi:hypothetical protein